MDKPAKGNGSDNSLQSHCFPVFHGMTPVNKEEEETPCHLFRPSYDVDSDQNGYRPSSILSSNPDPDQNDDTAERRHKSYNTGIIAGQKDAHCLVHEELTPGLEKFSLTTNQFNERLAHITEGSVRNVLTLAMEIVRKILGEPISLKEEDLTSIYREIRGVMNRAYTISMRMNSDDFESLSAMVKCSPGRTLGGDGVQLTGDSHVQKGMLHCDEADPGLSFEPIDQALTQIFDHMPST